MINRLSPIIWLFCVTVFMAAGCEYQQRKDELARGPDVKSITVTAEYATRALQATGGLQNWTKARKLQFDGVVTCFEPDDSFYLTEHHYDVYPWSNSIRISAREPLSKFIWQWSNGQFSILQGDIDSDVSPLAGSYRDVAEAILTIMTAPVRFLDPEATFTPVPTPVRIKGLWHRPINRTITAASEHQAAENTRPHRSTVVFYQNRENSLADVLWFANFAQKKFLLVHGYDYTQTGKKAVMVPAKIEISRTDARGTVQQRLAEINLK